MNGNGISLHGKLREEQKSEREVGGKGAGTREKTLCGALNAAGGGSGESSGPDPPSPTPAQPHGRGGNFLGSNPSQKAAGGEAPTAAAAGAGHSPPEKD